MESCQNEMHVSVCAGLTQCPTFTTIQYKFPAPNAPTRQRGWVVDASENWRVDMAVC